MLDALAEQEERIAARLRKLRADEGHPTRPGFPLPADLAAEKAGVKYRQWQRWEQGRTMPRSTSLEQVAEAFGVDVAEFYATEEGQPTQLDRIEENTEQILTLLKRPERAEAAEAPTSEDEAAALDADAARLSEAIGSPATQAPGRSANRRAVDQRRRAS